MVPFSFSSSQIFFSFQMCFFHGHVDAERIAQAFTGFFPVVAPRVRHSTSGWLFCLLHSSRLSLITRFAEQHTAHGCSWRMSPQPASHRAAMQLFKIVLENTRDPSRWTRLCSCSAGSSASGFFRQHVPPSSSPTMSAVILLHSSWEIYSYVWIFLFLVVFILKQLKHENSWRKIKQ